MLKFKFKCITVSIIYIALLGISNALSLGELKHQIDDGKDGVSFGGLKSWISDKLSPQPLQYDPLEKVTVRPWWDILGQYFPSLGEFFTKHDNSAIGFLNKEVRSMIESGHSDHLKYSRRYEIDNFPPFSFLLDFRMYPLIIGTFIIATLLLSLIFPRLRDTAKRCLPVFFSIFLIKYIAAAAILLGGGVDYYLIFSNIWFGNLAAHFYVSIADILLFLVLFLYLKSIKWYIKDSATKVIERFVIVYFRIFYMFTRYIFFVTMIYFFSSLLSGWVVVPLVSNIIPFISLLGNHGTVSGTLASIIFDIVEAFYGLFDFIQPFVNLIVTGTHYKIVPDLINYILTVIQSTGDILGISFFGGESGLFSFLSNFGWISSLASLGASLIIGMAYNIGRSVLFSFFSQKLQAATVKAAKFVIKMIRFRDLPNEYRIHRSRKSSDVKNTNNNNKEV
ncbi:uncharacterized protein VICG_01682 [Vittaforma corneae ATCC 50505]|uniref:Uncharacterized protein n=1 Tax=Vittaforma corneae (strain ATCC 50505) TaxID=993615 RepID=L2GKZ6_VITCO|nr:uncharacterized protein VICG_01682 [Vittaforma corneae ATCC 50505]ELA41309.1 hypothetical protein VICG_01682 [Vittaforma corneae ATCC 50505]